MSFDTYAYRENHRIQKWLNDDKLDQFVTNRNKQLIIELKNLDYEFSKTAVLLFFLSVELQVRSCTTMMRSVASQRRLIRLVIGKLKTQAVPDDYIPHFKMFIEDLKKRLKQVNLITNENLRLTEYWPFFQNNPLENFKDFKPYSKEETTSINWLLIEIKSWNLSHQEEVIKYLDSIQEEINTHITFLERKKDQKRQEKKAAAEKEKAEKKMIKEISENNRKHKIREKAIERSYGHLYKEAEASKKNYNGGLRQLEIEERRKRKLYDAEH